MKALREGLRIPPKAVEVAPERGPADGAWRPFEARGPGEETLAGMVAGGGGLRPLRRARAPPPDRPGRSGRLPRHGTLRIENAAAPRRRAALPAPRDRSGRRPPRPRPGREPPAEVKTAVIGPNIRIQGELSGDEDLVVEGRVEGKISVTKGLRIGPQAQVNAEVKAHHVVIAGRVVGNVIATEKVEILPSGILEGNIRAPKIAIAEGAQFKGSVDMGGKPAAELRGAERAERPRQEGPEGPQQELTAVEAVQTARPLTIGGSPVARDRVVQDAVGDEPPIRRSARRRRSVPSP